MASDPKKPSRQDQAAAWFAAERAGVMLVEQRAAFEAWKSDPRNQAALDAMRELWDDLAILKGSGPEPKRAIKRRKLPAAAAVAVAVLLVAGITSTSLLAGRETAIRTVAGQQTIQSMPDGSVIAVNVVSNLTYTITDRERRVTIEDGEASFSVKPDSTKPFVVRAGEFEIRAVGTAFNVRQRDGQLQVAVREGKVEICRSGAEGADIVLANLVAGQFLEIPATLPATAVIPAPVSVPTEQVSEWRMRIVTYENATVREVVEDFNRYFERKLLVREGDLLERRVTIRLQVEDRERAIETLAALLDAQVIANSGQDVLRN